ncbi:MULTISPECIES: N-acyl homoserine lactonase family protein [unclassified Rhodococcus (in: high G+C Gram-positive bacteria)]|uniref:N-acyl homoserine lactonase family protein n=1 Tax=unclassified Rhodococcus (in: high G+C Gram-positive bacteria) TaxID=192944 RepID=UPI0020CE77FA|nr:MULTISPECIES: N-acyl homoserine lactonase family protein [unclassified Rhodococcus (in: high G+C Gram-positive bacteria)]
MIDALRPAAAGTWTVLALQYASRTALRSNLFHQRDERSTESQTVAYYVWLALSKNNTVLIDAGISAATAESVDGLDYHGSPIDLLGELGLTPDDIDTCILTHLHYDHTGVVAELPIARYVVQRRELEYWTGPWAARITREHWLHSRADTEHIETADRGSRLDLVDGDLDLFPGLSVHAVGGHTAGMQVVRVNTDRGPVVLASDASHFYENFEDDSPFAILHALPDMYGAFDRIRELAAGSGTVVPGHDPLVRDRFAALTDVPGAHAVIIG